MGLNEKWKATVDDGLTNPAWDDYDDIVKAEISNYNSRFASTSGYKTVDWKLGKALVWVESGGPSNPAWKKRVLQIGNKGDPAHDVLKQGKENSKLIMSSQLAADVVKKIDEPKVNIQAGLAYLFTRMAKFEVRSVEDQKDKAVYTYTVGGGDTLANIASRVGTTLEVLRGMNPKIKNDLIRPKDVLQ